MIAWPRFGILNKTANQCRTWPSKTIAVTLTVMMLHVTVLSLVYQTALVLIGNLAAFPGSSRMATQFAGLVLIGMSIRLATGIR